MAELADDDPHAFAVLVLPLEEPFAAHFGTDPIYPDPLPAWPPGTRSDAAEIEGRRQK